MPSASSIRNPSNTDSRPGCLNFLEHALAKRDAHDTNVCLGPGVDRVRQLDARTSLGSIRGDARRPVLLTLIEPLEPIAILLPVDEVESIALIEAKRAAHLRLRETEVAHQAHRRHARLLHLA